jgi:hypothetical protein
MSVRWKKLKKEVMSTYDNAQAYRVMLHKEITNALEIVPHDTAFRTQLYKSICSISHELPLDVAAKIRAEAFETVNKHLKQIQ